MRSTCIASRLRTEGNSGCSTAGPGQAVRIRVIADSSVVGGDEVGLRLSGAGGGEGKGGPGALRRRLAGDAARDALHPLSERRAQVAAAGTDRDQLQGLAQRGLLPRGPAAHGLEAREARAVVDGDESGDLGGGGGVVRNGDGDRVYFGCLWLLKGACRLVFNCASSSFCRRRQGGS